METEDWTSKRLVSVNEHDVDNAAPIDAHLRSVVRVLVSVQRTNSR